MAPSRPLSATARAQCLFAGVELVEPAACWSVHELLDRSRLQHVALGLEAGTVSKPLPAKLPHRQHCCLCAAPRHSCVHRRQETMRHTARRSEERLGGFRVEALALLMLRVFLARDKQHATPPHRRAVLAQALHRGPHLHSCVRPPFQSLAIDWKSRNWSFLPRTHTCRLL